MPIELLPALAPRSMSHIEDDEEATSDRKLTGAYYCIKMRTCAARKDQMPRLRSSQTQLSARRHFRPVKYIV